MSSEPITQRDILLAQRELELERQAQELYKQNPLYWYTPHEKQYEFHVSNYRFRHARYGNQTGKSEMGSIEDISHAIGYRPFMERRFPVVNGKNEVVFWHEGYKGHPYATLGISPNPTKGLIICEDWDKSKEIFTEQEGENKGKLFTYIPPNLLGQPTRNHSGAIDRIPIKHRSGGWSVIHLDTVKSYKQNPMGSESSIWDWIHVDEPCPEKMFKAAARGLMARNGRAWLNLTPLTEPWIQDMFAPDLSQIQDDIANLVNGDKIMLVACMHDNPYLTPEGRDAYISLLSEDEKIARVQGIPLAYSGIVYKEFQYPVHVRRDVPVGWESWSRPPANYSIRFAIDYHPRKPHHVLFIATSPDGYQYAYAEIFEDCLMCDLVARIRGVLSGREATVPGLIDPLASTPNRVTDLSPMDEVIRLDLPILPATKDPWNGILKVKELLKSRDRQGRPIFQVNALCNRFLMEITRGFVWDGETNKPVKDKDDAMENFYRLCLQGLDYIEPAQDSDYRPIPLRQDFPSDLSSFYERDPFTETKPDRSKRYRR